MTTPFPFTSGQVLTAAQMNAITSLPLNDQTASYTALVGDVGKRIVMNVASANTVTFNNNVFAASDTIEVLNKGAGATTITAGAGVTLNGLSLVLSQYQGASITFLSASVALVFPTGGSVKTPRITRFTADGTFTPAAGVTYAVAHIRGGGGGSGGSTAGGAGGTSSVAFASGTISATGGNLGNATAGGGGTSYLSVAGVANSGQGGWTSGSVSGVADKVCKAGDGAYIVAGGAVTPGTGIAVVVGAGGTAGTSGAAGGSGYVFIETFE